jgi:hypothetical protein
VRSNPSLKRSSNVRPHCDTSLDLVMQIVIQTFTDAGEPSAERVRAANERAIGFYNSLGYAQDEVVSFGKRIIPDTAA